MKSVSAQRSLILVLGTLLFISVLSPAVFARKPYFKSFGGDVFTGGWFKQAASCSTSPSSNYQDQYFSFSPTYPSSNIYGGIQTYAKSQGNNSDGGASVEFAAFALGLIEGNSTDKGFYSGGRLAPERVKSLTFANSDNAYPWGGLMQGTTRQSYCIADYFGTQQNSPTVIPPGSLNLTSLGTGQYRVDNPGAITNITSSGSAIINKEEKITLFIDGNAYISSNIIYENNYTIEQVPKLTLVVKGSIYIDPAVTRLDGLYIAQPGTNTAATVATDEGVIWTCHPNNTAPLPPSYPNGCTNRLLVNGAFIAKQINLIRSTGDVAAASTAEDSSCAAAVKAGNNTAINSACGNIAEIFNYSPEMIVGGPFFNPPANSSLKIQSLISLPPVF